MALCVGACFFVCVCVGGETKTTLSLTDRKTIEYRGILFSLVLLYYLKKEIKNDVFETCRYKLSLVSLMMRKTEIIDFNLKRWEK